MRIIQTSSIEYLARILTPGRETIESQFEIRIWITISPETLPCALEIRKEKEL
tara:strand:- start:522 stop:680 length:159 start_codon:yes stop_codon:yes gene_type:complete